MCKIDHFPIEISVVKEGDTLRRNRTASTDIFIFIFAWSQYFKLFHGALGHMHQNPDLILKDAYVCHFPLCNKL